MGIRLRTVVHGFAARLPRSAVAALRHDPAVVAVHRDRLVAVAGDQADPPSWGLDRVDQRARPLDGRYHYDRDGTGVTAYVVDTGIRSDHTEFAGRVGDGFASIHDGNGTEDCFGHGTHVAGTIGGATVGIAKAVRLVPVRVLNCSGLGRESKILAGLGFIVRDHVDAPAVANMSLTSTYDPFIDDAVEQVIEDGVTVVVAAGNDGKGACRYSPADTPDAITVGAVDRNDQRASFSNFGRCLDVFAPGVGIVSAVSTTATAFATHDGTSMATPHVTGVAALVLEQDPTASPAEVTEAIIANATTDAVTNPKSPNRLLFSGFLAAVEEQSP